MSDLSLDDVADRLLERPTPVVSAPTLAEELDADRRRVLEHLRVLERSDEVASTRTGARSVAWWHTERVRPPRTPGDASGEPPSTGVERGANGESGAEERDHQEDATTDRDDRRDTATAEASVSGRARDTDATPAANPEGDDEHDDAVARALDDAVADAVDSWDDQDARLEARRDAARSVLEHLREEPLSKSEIVDRYADEYPVSGQNSETWWRKNLAEGANAPLKAVASYNRGTHEWELDDDLADREP